MKKICLLLIVCVFLSITNAQIAKTNSNNSNTLKAATETCVKNYLTTKGNKLYDSGGKEVFLRGVNWFGFETAMGFFHGIWSRDHKSMLQQIKDQGFNCIRIPWNNAILTQDITGEINAYGVDPYTGVSPMNEEEATKSSPLEILDITVQWCQENNMKIILDNHSREPDGYMVEALWYTAKVSHQKWISDWVFMTERYKDYDAVIAMDINNEPHGAYGAGSRWGTGNPENDWRLAAQECGNAILAVNPDVLIMVEGTEEFGETSYWWGGNLQGAREYPVVLSNPNKLVYSPHEYGPTVHNQEWFSAPTFPDNLPDIWETNFNFLHTNNTSPLFFGEYGIRDAGGKDEIWFDKLIEYMGNKGHHWTFWCWNPNSGDTGGLLDNQWTNVVEWKMEKIRPYLADEIPNCQSSVSVPVQSVALTPAAVTLNETQEFILTTSFTPSNASNKNVTYTSSNVAIATVDATGTVIAQSVGTATITVTSADGNYTATSLITVSDEVIPKYTLSVSTEGMGTVSVFPDNTTYTEGSRVTLNANATEGYSFTGWSGDAAGTEANLNIVMDGDKVITAIFSASDEICDSPTPITLKYSQDGVGTFCWETAEDIGYMNSWNVDKLEVNGIDIANVYTSSFPDKINGKYYIQYQASVAWAHAEIDKNTTKSATQTTEVKNMATTDSFSFYPNPVEHQITIVANTDIICYEIFNILGKKVFVKKVNGANKINLQPELASGIYILKALKKSGSSESKMLIVK